MNKNTLKVITIAIAGFVGAFLARKAIERLLEKIEQRQSDKSSN